MRNIVALFFIFAILSASGCVAPSEPTQPEQGATTVSSLADYAKTWNVVVDGNYYATMTFDLNGVLVSSSAPQTQSGLITVGSRSDTFQFKENLQPDKTGTGAIYYQGCISPDKLCVYGLYSKLDMTGEVKGRWCATAEGYPYLTNADMQGWWERIGNWNQLDGQNVAGCRFQFGADGKMVQCTDHMYVPNSGSVEFTGGLGLVIRDQIYYRAGSSVVTINNVYAGKTALLKTTASGWSTSEYTPDIRAGNWDAAKMLPGNG